MEGGTIGLYSQINDRGQENVRQKSFLSLVGKICERVVECTLSLLWQEKHNPDMQHGFRAKHSSVHQLIKVVEKINRRFSLMGLFPPSKNKQVTSHLKQNTEGGCGRHMVYQELWHPKGHQHQIGYGVHESDFNKVSAAVTIRKYSPERRFIITL